MFEIKLPTAFPSRIHLSLQECCLFLFVLVVLLVSREQKDKQKFTGTVKVEHSQLRKLCPPPIQLRVAGQAQ